MTDYSPSDDLSLALALAGNADLISLDRFTALDLVVTTKPDRTPVTDADQAVERSIRAGILAARPGDSILGEEYGTEGDSSRQWIIDPIDGTANFLRGVPIWGTLISLAIDGVPVVGVVSAPALGKRWYAAAGHGAFAQAHGEEPRRLRVSAVGELADAAISYNSIQGWDGAGYLDELVELSRGVWRARSIGDMWAYMLLARRGERIRPQAVRHGRPHPHHRGGGRAFHLGDGRTRPVARQRARLERRAARRRSPDPGTVTPRGWCRMRSAHPKRMRNR
jgi:histidinol-phosphatase